MNPGSRGYSLTEFLIIAALIVAVLSIGLPAFGRFYKRHQRAAAGEMVQTLVQRARMSALKEKRSYRVLIHDEDDSPANTIELQRVEGGSFVTVSGEVHPVPGAIRVLGALPTDSMDSVTVNGRGECTSGNVFLTAAAEDVAIVTISTICFAETS